MYKAGEMLENPMVMFLSKYDPMEQDYEQEDEKEALDCRSKEMTSKYGWDFITRSPESELAFYQWAYEQNNISVFGDYQLQIGRAIRTAENKINQAEMAESERDYVLDADGWDEFVMDQEGW